MPKDIRKHKTFATGSRGGGSDYWPWETPLQPGSTQRIATAGGRLSDSDWAYFDFERNGNRGLILWRRLARSAGRRVWRQRGAQPAQ